MLTQTNEGMARKLHKTEVVYYQILDKWPDVIGKMTDDIRVTEEVTQKEFQKIFYTLQSSEFATYEEWHEAFVKFQNDRTSKLKSLMAARLKGSKSNA